MQGVAFYKHGLCLVHPPRDDDEKRTGNHGGGKRGKLEGKVSKASFRRLRQWCITHDISGICWGVTLTVPGLELVEIEQFKKIHHKLCVFCNLHKIPLVWRVELQKRGQPHIHSVIFSSIEVVLLLLNHWYKLLDSLPCVLNCEHIFDGYDDLVMVSRAYLSGSSHAIEVQQLQGDFRAWRYLVSHMSKSKQSQLGWCGRNWGVCNRSLFRHEDGDYVELDDISFYRVRRWVNRLSLGKPSINRGRRVNKFLEKILNKGVEKFQKRHLARSGRVFSLSNPDTVRKMVEFATCDFTLF